MEAIKLFSMNCRDRYKRIVKSKWLRDAYSGMSNGENIQIEE